MSTPQDHPFAAFLKIIGKGPNMSRPLTREEARAAMSMIIAGDVLPEQLGAFLLLLRNRGETADELAGFIDAARDAIDVRSGAQAPDIDWPSYADRHRQQPWFVLAALLLAQNGHRVLMHGIAGDAEGYAPTRPVLAALGIEPARDMAAAMAEMGRANFAYIGLEDFLPDVEALFHKRPVLGVRTMVNTFARAINPLRAPCQLQGVVHPPYRDTHQQVAALLNQPRSVVFKGGGGEVQRNPLKSCRVVWVREGDSGEDEWPATFNDVAHDWRAEPLDPARVPALWRGDLRKPAIEAAITGTAAIALHTLGPAMTIEQAETMANEMWAARDKTKFNV